MRHILLTILTFVYGVSAFPQTEVKDYFTSLRHIIDSLVSTSNKDAVSFISTELYHSDYIGQSSECHYVPVYSVYKHLGYEQEEYDPTDSLKPDSFFAYFPPHEMRVSYVFTFRNHHFDHVTFERFKNEEWQMTDKGEKYQQLGNAILQHAPCFILIFGNCDDMVFLLKESDIVCLKAERRKGSKTTYSEIDPDDFLNSIIKDDSYSDYLTDYTPKLRVADGVNSIGVDTKKRKSLALKDERDKETPMELGRNLLAKEISPVLTEYESTFLNERFMSPRGDFDFKGKKCIFLKGAVCCMDEMSKEFYGNKFLEYFSYCVVSDKKCYLSSLGKVSFSEQLIILNEKERKKYGFDVVIIYGGKRVFTKKEAIRTITKNKNLWEE